MTEYIIQDGEELDSSGLRNLAIHIILKALEDFYGDTEDADAYHNHLSAKDFFQGGEFDTTYPIWLSYLGWDTEELGLITPERWYDIIENEYSSLAEARPKLGLSTRLIPKGSKLWEKIREGRERSGSLPLS